LPSGNQLVKIRLAQRSASKQVSMSSEISTSTARSSKRESVAVAGAGNKAHDTPDLPDAADCDAIFGEFLHHFHYLGLRGEDEAKALDAGTAGEGVRHASASRKARGKPPPVRSRRLQVKRRLVRRTDHCMRQGSLVCCEIDGEEGRRRAKFHSMVLGLFPSRSAASAHKNTGVRSGFVARMDFLRRERAKPVRIQLGERPALA